MRHAPYSSITIIYNPNSTGKSRKKAEALAVSLRAAVKGTKIRIRASKRRGHMEQIAYRTALLARHALIIAVSGDGGYNEVINGVLRARRLGRTVTAGLVPSGNANDHYASIHRDNFVARVASGDEDAIDVLEISGRSRHRPLKRFGHSYIGIGISPQAGEKLNERRLNLWEEAKIVISVLVHPKSVKLVIHNKIRHYDSLLFSNTGRMSKVIRLSKKASPHDGEFEVSHLYNRNKIKLIGSLARAAIFGLETDERTDTFTFGTVRATKVQVDGEIFQFDAGSSVQVVSRHRYLRCIV